MDYSAESADFLADRGFNVVHGDAQNFTLDRQFDVIVAGDLIEHLENQAGFLESCKRHLKPDGKIVVSTPNPWFWKYLLLAVIHREVPNNAEHTGWFCPRTYRQLCERFDLELTGIEFGSRYLRDRIMPLPRGWKHTSWHGTLVLKEQANQGAADIAIQP